MIWVECLAEMEIPDQFRIKIKNHQPEVDGFLL